MNITIMQWNALSLQKHSNELKNFIATAKNTPDLISVSETFLKPTQNFTLSGYEIVRKDRGGVQKGGGVATLIRSGIKYQNINFNFSKLEAIVIEIFCQNNQKVTIVNVYDPPDHLVDLDDYRQVFGIGGRVIIAGDFNAHNPLWKSEQMDRRGSALRAC